MISATACRVACVMRDRFAVQGCAGGCGRYLGHRLWEVVQHLLGAGMQKGVAGAVGQLGKGPQRV